MTEQHRWAEVKEAGFVSGMRFLFWLYRHSPFMLELTLKPVVLYYFISSPPVRAASLDYFRHLQKSSKHVSTPPPNWPNVYRHLSSFARGALDKLGVWADPQRFANLEFPNRKLLLDQIDTGQGAILLGAHLGSMEVCRRISKHTRKMKLNVLVHTKHADKFNRLLTELNASHELELIEVSELTPATAIRLSDCIARGEFIAILADRIPIASQGRAQAVNFMGADAYFPEGPFIIASLLKCPVYTLFCVREQHAYVVHCEKFAQQIMLPRKNRPAALTEHIQNFANILEKNVHRAPLQWFNLFPFWKKPL